MNKIYIQIPENIYHLGDYTDLQRQFPQGSFILDKTVTGCGATTMFLSDSIPTILCSARVELMHCKANAPEFIGKIHEFRKFHDYSTPVIDLENQIMDYIYGCNNITPKILVSYDSFKHVAQVLSKKSLLNRFRIIVDEAQTLFTDAAFKGEVEIEFLENLINSGCNVIFLSATPFIEKYLDQIDIFKNLTYVELVWPESSIHPTNIERLKYYRDSPKSTAKKIIDNYRVNGCFQEKMVGGCVVRSTEAVFFINDVSLILNIIKDNHLTDEETNIICAVNDANEKRLEKVGFSIGHAPKKGEAHKTFSFVTKCAFEGVDFYSTSAYTYIFSNITLNNLALDISLDLPQIMGRQRLGENPFKYDATFYYKTAMDFNEDNERAFEAIIKKKKDSSDTLLDVYNNLTDANARYELGRVYRSSQKEEKYTKDYVAVIDDTTTNQQKVTFNILAMYNEIRAWEVQRTQYTDGCKVMRSIEDATKSITENKDIDDFLRLFSGDFECRMKMYCEFLQVHPELKEILEALPQIQLSIKEYYNCLGPDIIRSLSYVEAAIKRKISESKGVAMVVAEVTQTFVKGQFYTLKQVKEMLQSIYDARFGCAVAKASDLENFIGCKLVKRTISGHREKGYEIL